MTTVPMVIMLVSVVLWFVASAPSNTAPWWRSWLIEVLRILFAVSAFWVLAGVSGRTVF